MKKKDTIVFLSCIVIIGCQLTCRPAEFVDTSQDLPLRHVYDLEIGDIGGFAWLDLETLVIDIIDEGNYPRIEVLNLDTSSREAIRIEAPCKRPYTRGLTVLPNRHAGFLLSCSDQSQIIQQVDLPGRIAQDLYVEPSITWVSNFSYSPDMSELVLVDNRGLYLNSNLVYVDRSGRRTDITPDFQVADFPAWSPTENVVAFLGIKRFPGSEDFESWSETEKVLDHPWKLYLFDPKNDQVIETALEVVHPNRLVWSPDGNLIGFSGEYEGALGIWLVRNYQDPEKMSIVRVVRGIAVFGFSPDNKSMVFASGTYGENPDPDRLNKIYVIDLTPLAGNP